MGLEKAHFSLDFSLRSTSGAIHSGYQIEETKIRKETEIKMINDKFHIRVKCLQNLIDRMRNAVKLYPFTHIYYILFLL